MSLIMQKSFRSKAERGVSYTLVFGVLFSFALIAIGFGSYVIPEIGFGKIESVMIALTGATILLFVMNNILMKVTTGRIRAYSIILSFFFVVIVFILALLGTGILEV